MKIEIGKWEFICISAMIVMVVLLTSFLTSFTREINGKIKEETIYFVDDMDTLQKIDSEEVYIKFKISCESDSMGLIMNCKDTIYSKLVTEKTKLREGRIYTYRVNENKSRIHRLLKCLDKKCTKLLFKGDANRFVDKIVNRNQIEKEVYQIKYG